jgi:hypothetical protein
MLPDAFCQAKTVRISGQSNLYGNADAEVDKKHKLGIKYLNMNKISLLCHASRDHAR